MQSPLLRISSKKKLITNICSNGTTKFKIDQLNFIFEILSLKEQQLFKRFAFFGTLDYGLRLYFGTFKQIWKKI
ncbi:hypothetical protein BpHYR1_032671 [Brachionus plicatilis]|uniref:Uncharacterized protein n=1 Tax=Brachionus plicatilis TaxID=10195 RepID=A0A3M7PS58_BRAPC|nr:hypothetical protein BpHYR1_032671 [Brachionus plicatilis]